MPGYCIDLYRWGAQYGGWRKKDGQAAEFKNSGHDYRLWKPDNTGMAINALGGMTVSYKMDHRKPRQGDSHCFVLVDFNKRGRIHKSEITKGKDGSKFAVKVSYKEGALEVDLDQAWRSVFPDTAGDSNFKNVVKISILKLQQCTLA